MEKTLENSQSRQSCHSKMQNSRESLKDIVDVRRTDAIDKRNHILADNLTHGPKTQFKIFKSHRLKWILLALNVIVLIIITSLIVLFLTVFQNELHGNKSKLVQYMPVFQNELHGNKSTLVQYIPEQCQTITAGTCLDLRKYNFTRFPNAFGHQTQYDAKRHLYKYENLVSSLCYKHFLLFACVIYFPKCNPQGGLVYPCKSLCKETIRRCTFFLDVFNLTMPENIDCDNLPDSPNEDVCIGYSEVQQGKMAHRCKTGYLCDRVRCIPNRWVCDGQIDCKDGTDEKNCTSSCNATEFQCADQTCIPTSNVCDGISHCIDAQDERNCIKLSGYMRSESQGILQTFDAVNQTWKSICSDTWNSSITAIACQQMGYTDVALAQPISWSEDFPGVTLGPVGLNSLQLQRWLEKGSGCERTQLQVQLHCKMFTCGVTPFVPSTSETRIVGGTAAKLGIWPWLAAIFGGPEEVYFCGGTLISDQWILTAAHCVGARSNTSEWTIKLGGNRRIAHSKFTQKFGVEKIIKHPQHNEVVTNNNDVALLKLTSPVMFNDFVRPICLPANDYELKPGTMCIVAGLGKKDTKDLDYNIELHQVDVPIISSERCVLWFQQQNATLTSKMLCAGYPEGKRDSCQGDSGGPLLCQDGLKRWIVAGVVSWGINCALPELPGVYAKIPLFVDWIKEVISRE